MELIAKMKFDETGYHLRLFPWQPPSSWGRQQ